MSKRIDHIDGLRGIAAMLVVIGHWAEMSAQKSLPSDISVGLKAVFLEYFSTGRTGVVAFFCISGFVIPFSFKGPHPLSGFVISRIFRLYPAYWLAIALLICITPVMPSTWNIIANMSMLTKFFNQPYILSISWTLTIEIIFYLICFMAYGVRLLHSPKFNFFMIVFFCTLALAMAAYRWWHPGSGMPAGLQTFLAAMHFGTLIRLWVFENKPGAEGFSKTALVVLSISVVIANSIGYFHATPSGPENDIGWIAINTGYFAGLCLFLACIRWRLFSSTPVVFLGAVSYALYLLHPVCLEMSMTLWANFARWPIALGVLTPLYLVASILLSAAVYYLVERPAIKIGRRIIGLLTPSQRPQRYAETITVPDKTG